MKHVVSAMLFAACVFVAPRSGAADLVLSVIPPAERVTQGQPAYLKLLAINSAAVEMSFAPGKVLSGRMFADKGKWDLQLEAVSPCAIGIQPGASGECGYRFAVPADASGRAVVEIALDDTRSLNAVVEIMASSSAVDPALEELSKETDMTDRRTFIDRLSPNEPTYFIAGRGENSMAKIQFSFNYRIGSIKWGNGSFSRLQFGYTERALWDIEAKSSPFHDTSYMPELSMDIVPRVRETANRWLSWMGAAGGVKHESNGRDGVDSRSMNTVYLRAAMVLGNPDSLQLILVPEVFTYLGASEHIKDYRGYGRFRAVLGKQDGPALLATAWSGSGLHHLTYQLDLSQPIRTRLLKVEAFLLLQYFNGYGESLKDYDRKTNALRLGIAFVR